MVNDVLFQRLTETVHQPLENTSEGVHAITRDPLYIACQIAELSTQSMIGCCEIYEPLPGEAFCIG